MTVQVITGDCLDVLRTLPDESVHCCVTSPPYWGLRDYGHAGQIGLEASPEEYVENIVRVFREVARVLGPEGTLWLNLGDTYAGNRSYQVPDNKHRDVGNSRGMTVSHRRDNATVPRSDLVVAGIAAKNLLGIPWRVAFALQAAGWYLRSDIIWHKPNPMPESVTDRPTKAHEYIFLLSKSERYYYDQDAIREPYADSTLVEFTAEYTGQATKQYEGSGAQNASDVKRRITEKARLRAEGEGYYRPNGIGGTRGVGAPGQGANKRSVWTVTTKPYSGAHFATFPPDLIEPCILAGCPVGGTVLDPFFGAGTSGLVADRLQRNCIGIELNPTYADMARARITNDAPLFTEVA